MLMGGDRAGIGVDGDVVVGRLGHGHGAVSDERGHGRGGRLRIRHREADEQGWVPAHHRALDITEGDPDLTGEHVAEEVSLRHGHAHLGAEATEDLVHLHLEAARIGEAREGRQHLGQSVALPAGQVKTGLDVGDRVGRYEDGALRFAATTLGEGHQARARDDESGSGDGGNGPARESASAVRTRR